MKTTETDQLVIDPWAQLNRERQHEHLMLKYLKMYLRRAEMSTASGRMSEEFCLLCAKVPAGVMPELHRGTCPCKVVPQLIKEHEARLRIPLRRNKAQTPEPLPTYDDAVA